MPRRGRWRGWGRCIGGKVVVVRDSGGRRLHSFTFVSGVLTRRRFACFTSHFSLYFLLFNANSPLFLCAFLIPKNSLPTLLPVLAIFLRLFLRLVIINAILNVMLNDVRSNGCSNGCGNGCSNLVSFCTTQIQKTPTI